MPDGKECAPNEVCWDTEHTPPGFGTCFPEDTCTLDGKWPCKPGYVCQDTLHRPPGFGICVVEFVPEEPRIESWSLWQGGDELLEGDWVGAGPGVVEIITTGPGSGSGLKAWAGNVEATCQATQAGNIERYTWQCNFPSGFAGTDPTVTVEVQLGNAAVQSKTYAVDLSPMEAEFTLKGAGDLGIALVGDSVIICAEAKTEPGAPATLISIDNIVAKVDGKLLSTLVWTERPGNTATKQCMTARLPESVPGAGNLEVSADITVTDEAHNTATTNKSAQVPLTRVAVHETLNISSAVMPLAWVSDRLVIGTSVEKSGVEYGYVNFYTARTRNLQPGKETIGKLTGLVTLGTNGLVAITSNDQAAVMAVDGQLHPESEICLSGEGGVPASARFPHGLSLLSIGAANNEGNWRFAIAVNDANTDEGRLLTYAPGNAVNPCVLSNALQGEIVAPLVGMDNPLETNNPMEMMVVSKNPASNPFAHFQNWKYSDTTSIWGNSGTSVGAIIAELFQVNSAAASRSESGSYWNFWITSSWNNTNASRTDFGLMRGQTDYATSSIMAGINESISPLVLDANGRAYVVVKPQGKPNHELHMYAANAATDDTFTLRATLSTAAPVGSPILGQSRSGYSDDTEIYVLTTDGTLYAFRANNLALLWEETFTKEDGTPPTALNIAPTAQPVLRNNQLWFVSEDGELYAVVVNSNGLNRSAKWPKAYRDNCNSSSHHVAYTNLPNCF